MSALSCHVHQPGATTCLNWDNGGPGFAWYYNGYKPVRSQKKKKVMKRLQLGGYLKWAGWSWSASKQVLLRCCRQSSPTGGCRPGKQQFCWLFCRSYSIILASREPALIHSFLLWVKEGSRKDKRMRGSFDKRHIDCFWGAKAKMFGAPIHPHHCTSLSVKGTFSVLLGIFNLPSFSVGFYKSAFRRSHMQTWHQTKQQQKKVGIVNVNLCHEPRMPSWYWLDLA